MHGVHDASRAAALNYRPDAILMQSIIYDARHRPLNIPRPTKESLRDPGIIPGPEYYSRTVDETRISAQGTYLVAPLFSRTSNDVRREGAPAGEAPVAERGRGRFFASCSRIDFTGFSRDTGKIFAFANEELVNSADLWLRYRNDSVFTMLQ